MPDDTRPPYQPHLLENASADFRPFATATSTDRQVRVLELLALSPQPVGAPQVALQLAAAGIDLGEATVGRLMLDLEAKGLLRKTGRKGRSITAAGLERLRVFQRRQAHINHGIQMAYLLESANHGDLLDVLVARKAIEGETAYTAALRANPADVAYLENLLERAKVKVANGTYGGDDSAEFHLGIAHVARNKFLEAALQMILGTPDLFNAFVYARQQVSGPLLASHEEVVAAIRAGDPELAQRRMVGHIENVLVDLHRYWGYQPGGR